MHATTTWPHPNSHSKDSMGLYQKLSSENNQLEAIVADIPM
jgi:hypothetical protein